LRIDGELPPHQHNGRQQTNDRCGGADFKHRESKLTISLHYPNPVQILIFNIFFKTYRNICANAAMAGKARQIWEMAFLNYGY
jgi:hypothetical protein